MLVRVKADVRFIYLYFLLYFFVDLLYFSDKIYPQYFFIDYNRIRRGILILGGCPICDDHMGGSFRIFIYAVFISADVKRFNPLDTKTRDWNFLDVKFHTYNSKMLFKH